MGLLLAQYGEEAASEWIAKAESSCAYGYEIKNMSRPELLAVIGALLIKREAQKQRLDEVKELLKL